MRGILQIAYKLLINDRTKFAALLLGITFAVFLMIEMTSVFAGILSRSSTTAASYQDTVALYVALGGGWCSQERPGTPDPASHASR